MTDPIADLLTRIRNGLAAKRNEVLIPLSKQKEEICNLLVKEGYLESVEVVKQEPQSQLKVVLKYVGKNPAISKLQRISKPGRRVYTPVDGIKTVLSGYGVRVITTNKGVMTDKEAKKQNLGGEVICKVW